MTSNACSDVKGAIIESLRRAIIESLRRAIN
jgi:hypothetical protein